MKSSAESAIIGIQRVAFLRKSSCRAATRLFLRNRVRNGKMSENFKGKVIFMDTGNQFLGTERIGKLMRQYAVPCIISLLVGALYNIVDQIFIANASYLGSYGNAANTVAFWAPPSAAFSCC